ncbi:MAG TPA: NAD(P)-dependent oxidoreductase [Rectinemataceae bacterium]|nr:NAD(P)-dependent oxidoreductase [Rectinemataceae bacterium]
MAGKKAVGFIGTGVMGGSMAGHLLKAGYEVHVHTRTRSRADDLVAAGAVWEDDRVAVARKCEILITMVGYPSDVEEVYFGPRGIIENALPGAILVDMTTSRPDLAARIAAAAKAKGLGALDAPVSGGDIGAKNATLTIMVGGEIGDFEAAKPLFGHLGKTIVLQGGPGSGQHTKMANQIAIAASLLGAVESISYAKRAGLDPRRVLESIGSGSAGSWQLANLVPKMLDGNFEPGFYIKHFLKDLRIALESAAAMQLDLPGLRLAEGLFEILQAEGFADKGTQALWLLYERGLMPGKAR